jgi:cytochrome c-type biogenesis protein CcmH/NrfG
MTAWEYGAAMLAAGDVAAGLAVLQNLVAHNPNDLAQRQALRELERNIRSTQAADEQAAAAVLAEVGWIIHQAKHKRTAELIDWDVIDHAAELGLAIDPWDVELHLALGHACRARGYREGAQFAYRCALDIAPDRADIREYLGEQAE